MYCRSRAFSPYYINAVTIKGETYLDKSMYMHASTLL